MKNRIITTLSFTLFASLSNCFFSIAYSQSSNYNPRSRITIELCGLILHDDSLKLDSTLTAFQQKIVNSPDFKSASNINYEFCSLYYYEESLSKIDYLGEMFFNDFDYFSSLHFGSIEYALLDTSLDSGCDDPSIRGFRSNNLFFFELNFDEKYRTKLEKYIKTITITNLGPAKRYFAEFIIKGNTLYILYSIKCPNTNGMYKRLKDLIP